LISLKVMTPRFRFAPSPNGYLHLGHAYCALLNAKMAKDLKGELLLRIEDIDITRARPAYEQAIYDDLAWLGVEYLTPARRQSEHFSFYEQAIHHLLNENLLYKAYETRSELKAATGEKDPDGALRFPLNLLSTAEIARREATKAPYALRLRSEKTLHLHEAATPWGDVVLARKDIPASYHLCVVLDDALQKITHVVRGQDLEAATPLHILLQKIFGLPTPHYHHHALILDEQGEKLSKSKGATALRASGLSLESIVAEYKAKKLM
jgi:glutamyl-Q tRNA(Asp) synthetase